MPTDHEEHTSVLSLRRESRHGDLATVVRALDSEPETAVLPVVRDVAPPADTAPLPLADRRRSLWIVIAGIAAVGLLALLIAVVLDISDSPTQISPPLAPVTSTAPPSGPSAAPTTAPSEAAGTPAATPAPAAAPTPPPTAVVSAEMMAPEQPRMPLHDRLHQMFPNLFPVGG